MRFKKLTVPRLIAISLLLFLNSHGFSQRETLQRPKLVVGIVVDQMRWDFLYRFYDRYEENGGFKRMLRRGAVCENVMIPYVHTVTACGHASIYTGTTPSVHGITGNEWWDAHSNFYVYCTEDASMKTVGSNTAEAGAMSPTRLTVTTICDELRLATNGRGKVAGIALKDRGGILPAGHSANAAYWYDTKTGKWISSTYYNSELPGWVTAFNARKIPDSLYALGWNTLFPLESYVQSTKDNKVYENRVFGNGFPYSLTRFAGNSYNPIIATPHGNTLTSEFAKALLQNEGLGSDGVTDFLAISYSSPDYVGHSFGPNSVEQEDNFLRLDRNLGELMDFLDQNVGAGQYLLFLTSDHGAAQIPAFLGEQKIPAGHVNSDSLADTLNSRLAKVFGVQGLVSTVVNYQVVLNKTLIEARQLSMAEIKSWLVAFLAQQPGILHAIDLSRLEESGINLQLKEMIRNSYFPGRSGDIQLIYFSQWIDGFEKSGTTHGVWNPYDAHVPLLWYGWSIKPKTVYQQVLITDIAPTLASLLKIQMPSGCTGKVIKEILE